MITTQAELLRRASQEYLFGNATLEEQIDSVRHQIANPFSVGSANYLKPLKRLVSGQDELDEICKELFEEIQDVFPGIVFDVDDYDQHMISLFDACYKFFVQNVAKLMYLFIKQYLFNNKNRHGLTDDHSDGIPADYPKAQYGKKEFFILSIRLKPIIKDIFSDNAISVGEFIEYVEKDEDCPPCVSRIREALDDGVIVDKGVVAEMFNLYRKSDRYRRALNKLEMDFTNGLILPYLSEKKMLAVRYFPVEELPTEDDDESEDDEE